jgi:hypothetical protein
VTLHGLSCGVCKLKAHKACVANVLTVCKWTTIHTVDPAAITHENVSPSTGSLLSLRIVRYIH